MLQEALFRFHHTDPAMAMVGRCCLCVGLVVAKTFWRGNARNKEKDNRSVSDRF
jgi:hypothetical protein